MSEGEMAPEGSIVADGGLSETMPPRLSETSYDDEDDLVRATAV